MRKLERILLVVIVLTAIINLFEFPGTTLLLTVSYCSLAFTYMLIGVLSLGKLGIGLIVTKPLVVEYTSDNSIFPSIKSPDGSVFSPVGWKQKLGLFFVCYCLSIMVLAILFRMSYWGGSSVMLTFGILQSAIAFVPILIKQIGKPSLFYRQLLLRISIFLVACVLLLTLPARFFIDIKYRNNPEISHQTPNR
jgi:asparagine N-glycosylation enzyme membrane subunit Stt3